MWWLWMNQSCFSLGFLSQNSLWKLSTFHGYKGLYIVGWERNVKIQFFPNRVVWRLDLATGLSREFKPRANGLASLGFLSYSATAGMTLQLPACSTRVPTLAACQPRVSPSLHNHEHFFTLSHSLPLHDSHLNTGLLIAKIQANLARNKGLARGLASRLDWVASSSHEVTERPVVLFCPAVLQLAWCFNFWHAWHVCIF